jgi:hypothetical protein
MKPYTPPKASVLSLDPVVDDRFGVVYKAGSPNTDYLMEFWHDDL